MSGPSERAVPGVPIEQAAELIKLAAKFDDGVEVIDAVRNDDED